MALMQFWYFRNMIIEIILKLWRLVKLYVVFQNFVALVITYYMRITKLCEAI